jgi:hypothetical protein
LAGLIFMLAPCAAADEAAEGAPPSGNAGADRPRLPHPEPRIIVNVLSVRGPHTRAEVERSARRGWGKIVRCYKSIDDGARGAVEAELIVAGSGKVTSARRTRTTLKNRELATCVAKAMKGLAMPKARARSIASVEIRVAPGDPPPRNVDATATSRTE